MYKKDLGWLAYSTAMMILFLWFGANLGIGMAMTHGGDKACEMLRWTILDCSYQPQIQGEGGEK